MAIREEHTLAYGDATITYALKRHRRGGQSVRISVNPEGRVRVSASENVPEDAVQQVIAKRAGWIWKQLQSIKHHRKHVLPRLYVDGECHFYLGRRHVLKIVPREEVLRDARRPLVRMLRGKIEVASRFAWSEDETAQKMRQSEVRELVRRWYGIRAKAVISARLKALIPSMPWVQTFPKISYLTMKTRWASCSSNGLLCINIHLVKAPTHCIDTVLCHELCHIQEHNHSPRFWKLLTSVRPDWKKDMEYLDAMGELYLSG